jgi:hypothetical protein
MLAQPSNYEAIRAEDIVGYIYIVYLYQIVRPYLAQQCNLLIDQLLIYAQTAQDVFYFPKGIWIEWRQGKSCADTTSLVGAPNAG